MSNVIALAVRPNAHWAYTVIFDDGHSRTGIAVTDGQQYRHNTEGARRAIETECGQMIIWDDLAVPCLTAEDAVQLYLADIRAARNRSPQH